MDLRLDEPQVELLREVLDQALRDLRYEIADTDHLGYKRDLRERETRLRGLVDMVGGPLPNRR